MNQRTLLERLTPEAKKLFDASKEDYPYMHELAEKALNEKLFVIDLTVEELNCIADLTDLGNWNSIYTIFN
jgi:hypothetical protein